MAQEISFWVDPDTIYSTPPITPETIDDIEDPMERAYALYLIGLGHIVWSQVRLVYGEDHDRETVIDLAAYPNGHEEYDPSYYLERGIDTAQLRFYEITRLTLEHIRRRNDRSAKIKRKQMRVMGSRGRVVDGHELIRLGMLDRLPAKVISRT